MIMIYSLAADKQDGKKGTMKKLHSKNICLTSFLLKDESLEDLENLPAPDVLAREIADNLESALDQFNSIYEDLEEK